MSTGFEVPVAREEKFGRLKSLMDTGKEKGFVLYDEVNELLPDDKGIRQAARLGLFNITELHAPLLATAQ